MQQIKLKKKACQYQDLGIFNQNYYLPKPTIR